jgi:hypothetical protein
MQKFISQFGLKRLTFTVYKFKIKLTSHMTPRKKENELKIHKKKIMNYSFESKIYSIKNT